MFGNSQSHFEDTVNEEIGNGGGTKFNAKTLLNETLKFGISSRAGSEQPINTKSLKMEGSMGERIQKYIVPKTADKGFSLTKMYDNNLDLKQKPMIQTQNQKQQDKNRRFDFVMTKMHQ